MTVEIHRNAPRACALRASLMATLLFSAVSPAFADTIMNCGDPIDAAHGNGVLGRNLPAFTGSGPCLEVKDGRTLNFGPYTITCSASSCGQAVLCSGASESDAIVTTGTNNDSTTNITGPFVAAVKNCGTVKNLKIAGAATGILFDDSGNGKDYQANVIDPAAGGTGIDVKLGDATDSVQDNRITGGAVGIFLREGRNTTTAPLVRDNIIRAYTDAGIKSTVTSNDYFRIETNAITDGGTGSAAIDVDGLHATYTNNICQDAGDVANPERCSCQLDKVTLYDLVNSPNPCTL